MEDACNNGELHSMQLRPLYVCVMINYILLQGGGGVGAGGRVLWWGIRQGCVFPNVDGREIFQTSTVPGHTASNPGTEDGSYDGCEKSLFD